MRSLPHFGFTIALFVAAALILGCLESKYPLGPKQAGKIDSRLLGDWTLEQRNPGGQIDTTALVVRNIRNEEYYIEWQTPGEQPFRATAWTSDINGVMFANLLPMSDSGDVHDKYTILRVDLEGREIKIRNLNPEFFESRKFTSSEELRAIVAENLENEQMYKDEPLIGTKQQ